MRGCVNGGAGGRMVPTDASIVWHVHTLEGIVNADGTYSVVQFLMSCSMSNNRFQAVSGGEGVVAGGGCLTYPHPRLTPKGNA